MTIPSMNLLAPTDGDSGTKAAKLLAAVECDAPKSVGGHVRPAEAADMAQVGRLFTRIFDRQDGPAPPALTAYLAELFLDAPDRDPEIGSKVHVRGDGTVNGFIGVLPLPLRHEGRDLRGAVCGSLMVDERDSDPFAGARLMRSFLSGPQDISLSETANPISEGMWRKLRGTILPAYSLEWVRVLRPAGFAVDVAALSLPVLGAMRPIALPMNALARRFASGVLRATDSQTAQDRDVGIEELAELIQLIIAKTSLHPAWSPPALRRMLGDASRKSRYGTFIARAVTVRGYARSAPSSITSSADVSPMSCRSWRCPARRETCSTASSFMPNDGRGCRSRPQPAIPARRLLTRNCFHVHRASSLVHARDPDLLEPFIAGRAFFNGLGRR